MKDIFRNKPYSGSCRGDAPVKTAMHILILMICITVGRSHLMGQFGVWSPLQNYPLSRTGHTLTHTDGYAYLLGGMSGSTHTNTAHRSYTPPSSIGPSNWVALAPMNSTRYLAASSGAANGKVYVFGGYVNGTIGTNVEEYDPNTNTWTTKAPMPVAKARHKAVRLGGRIFVMGGVNAAGVATNTMHIYYPATNTWTTAPSMPTAKIDFGAVVQRRTWPVWEIVIAGGRPNLGPTGSSSVEIYNLTSSTWSTSAFGLPIAVYGNHLAVDTSLNVIISSGGRDNAGNYLSTCNQNYDPGLMAWSAFPALLRPMADHHTFAATTFGYSGDLFAVGGVTTGNVQVTNFEHTWIWVVLPAQEISLTAQVADDHVAVQWEHDPSDVVSYRLERSADGIQFDQVGSEMQPGNATLHQTIDPNPFSGTSYYRIGIHFADGRQQISEAVAVTVVHAQLLARVISNDLTHIYTLQYQLPQAESHASVSISDISGKRLHRFDLTENQGILPMDLALYPAGIYFVHVATPTQSKTLKIRVL